MYYFLAVLIFFSSHLLHGAQKKFEPFLDKHEKDTLTVYDKGFLPWLRLVVIQVQYNSGNEYKAFISFNSHKSREEVNWIETSPQEAFAYFHEFEKEHQSKDKKRRATV